MSKCPATAVAASGRRVTYPFRIRDLQSDQSGALMRYLRVMCRARVNPTERVL